MKRMKQLKGTAVIGALSFLLAASPLNVIASANECSETSSKTEDPCSNSDAAFLDCSESDPSSVLSAGSCEFPVRIKVFWANQNNLLPPETISMKLLSDSDSCEKDIIITEEDNWEMQVFLENIADPYEIRLIPDPIPDYTSEINPFVSEDERSLLVEITNTYEPMFDEEDSNGLSCEPEDADLNTDSTYSFQNDSEDSTEQIDSFTTDSANGPEEGMLQEIQPQNTESESVSLEQDPVSKDETSPNIYKTSLFGEASRTVPSSDDPLQEAAQTSAETQNTPDSGVNDITHTDPTIQPASSTLPESIPSQTSISSENSNKGTIPEENKETTTSIQGTITWDDSNNIDGIRPSSVIVYAVGGDKSYLKTVSSDSNWSYSFTDLPKYRPDGSEIIYVLYENPIDGYTTAAIQNNIINTHVPEVKTSTSPTNSTGSSSTASFAQNTSDVSQTSQTTTISGRLNWIDNNNAEKTRPSYVIIHLLADGKAVRVTTITESSGWTYSFPGMSKYNQQGSEIRYTVNEDDVKNYTKVISGYQITNTLTKLIGSMDANGNVIQTDGGKEEADASQKEGIVQTGDASPILPFAIILGGSLLTILVIIIINRKHIH